MSAPVPNLSLDLSGQVAFVTGASSGLGRHFAEILAASGARVAVAARRLDRLEEVVAGIRAKGGDAVAIPVDIADPAMIAGAVDAAEAAFGTVTILINNAGQADGQYATKMPLDLIDKVIATNVRAPFLMAREVARRLIARGLPGRIVNISSMLVYDYSHPGGSLYAVTKATAARMAEVLAVEWARHGINVNAIAPGAFHSEMMDAMISRMGEIASRFPRRRMGQPSQLDSTLLSLVSPSSDFVTGTIVKVDDAQHPR